MSKKNLLIMILGIVLIGAVAAGGYFYFLQPLNNQLESKQAELDMANQQLTILENKLSNTSEETANSTMKLQKQIPVKRSVEQLMLDIEKAETVSNVTIKTITMGSSGADESVETAAQQTPQDTNENQADTKSDNQDQTNGKETASTTVLDEETDKQAAVLPSGVKKTPFTINGEAKNYFELQKFLDSLQALPRKIKLDNLSFKGLTEVMDAGQQNEKITFDLSVSAFYFPKLADLHSELPPIDTPDAANKKNPFNELPTNSGK
ncbi:pilus assembly protein PilO [Bacillus benzoevorans]|uniref:Type IV pilus assembly protein PilO n=1 Tax=Bacillus benzoevorans TaxID=1456 RepID=A0A7X0LVU0_9BACI|nr:pilus assembly protein PilO [Bacillus benzoevorans]MBB6445870.1 type IV pilus assembly protein PilO [Bacillus benzoevorans]